MKKLLFSQLVQSCFFSEFRPQKILRIPVFLNIATESKQYIVKGELKNEKANLTIGAGLVFKMMQYNLDAKSKIELELGGLGSVIFAENKIFVWHLF